MGLFLLDANVLIDAHRDYYPLGRVPEFWEWLAFHGNRGDVKIPLEIWEEVADGKGELVEWMNGDFIEGALCFDLNLDPAEVARVVDNGYAPDLRDDEIEKLGRDPFLIAAAARFQDACIVTTEVSKPSRRRANRHIPDVCRDLGISSCDTYELARRLDFRTGWRVI